MLWENWKIDWSPWSQGWFEKQSLDQDSNPQLPKDRSLGFTIIGEISQTYPSFIRCVSHQTWATERGCVRCMDVLVSSPPLTIYYILFFQTASIRCSGKEYSLSRFSILISPSSPPEFISLQKGIDHPSTIQKQSHQGYEVLLNEEPKKYFRGDHLPGACKQDCWLGLEIKMSSNPVETTLHWKNISI